MRAFIQPPALSETVSKYAVRQDGILRIIGEGEIGDKARSLNRDAEGYKKAGLYVGERLVLAQSVLEDFLRYNSICNTLEEGNSISDIEKLILDPKTKFPPELEAAIAREIGAFPESGLTKQLFNKLPKKYSVGIEHCEIDFEKFRRAAKYIVDEPDLALLQQEFGHLRAAADSKDGWKIAEREKDDEGKYIRMEKEIPLGDKFIAVLSVREVVAHEDAEYLKWSKSQPREPAFALFTVAKHSLLAPAIARSSAKGDDEGTGAYGSFRCKNSLERVLESSKKVLASYYSPKARDLRATAATGEGFGIIIEPAVGRALEIKNDYPIFAPVFSGVAEIRAGEIVVAVDLGFGGVVGGGGETIDWKAMEKAGGVFSRYVDIKAAEASKHGGFGSKLIYSLSGELMEEMKRTRGYDIGAGTVFPEKGEAMFEYYRLECEVFSQFSTNIMEHADKFNFLEFAARLKEAAKIFGRDMRIEFAACPSEKKGAPGAEAHVVQSSIIQEKKGSFSLLEPKGERICLVDDILGQARFKFRQFFEADSREAVARLENLDATREEPYVAIVGQWLSSNDRNIHLRNAGGVIGFGENQEFGNTLFAGIGGTRHYKASKLLNHFPHYMEKTGRFFASSSDYPLSDNNLLKTSMIGDLKVVSAPKGYYFEALATGKGGSLRIYLCKDE